MKVRLRREDAPLLAAAVVGTLFRAIYFHQLRATPAFLQPVLDASAHLEWARGLLAGTWPPPEAFFRAPGYVVFLAAELAVLGDDPVRVAEFQCVLGAITAVLTAAVARRFFGTASAWAAGLGAALYPTFAFFDAQLLTPVLEIPLVLGAVLAAPGAGARPARPRTVAAGLLWSVAVVVRPPLLLAAAVLPVTIAGGEGRRRRDWKSAILAAAAIVSLPLVLTARNAAVGDPVFLASQGGLNLYLGNNSRADGMAATFPDDPAALGYRMMESARSLAERAEGRSLGSADVSAYWTERTLDDVVGDPGRWIALELRKAALFWGAREIPNNHDPVLFAETVPVLRLPGWGLWAPLGLVGLIVAWRRPGAKVLAGVVLAVLVGCVGFFVCARFRLPAAPFLIAAGGGAVATAVGAVARRRWPPVAGIATAVVLLALLVRANPYGIPSTPWVTSYVLVAEAEAARREPVRALRWIERALEESPGLYAARVAEIDLLRRSGRIPEARARAEAAVRLLPEDPALRASLGALLDLSGDPEGALRELDAALARDPSYEPALISRAVVLTRLGRPDEATAALRKFLLERPGSPERERAASVLRAVESGALDPEGED
ncbi:MAG TPA: tetratricopeptide repeat protein [bacterium]|nr:tetratricopeptide repeat protein [bacterium]